MKPSNVSIKWKLFGYLALFVAVMIGLLWVFQIVFLDRFYQHIKTQQIQKSAELIAQNIDNAALQDLVDQVAQSEGICIIVTEPGGGMRASSSALFDCVIHRMPPEELDHLRHKATENRGAYLETFSPPYQRPPWEFKGKGPVPDDKGRSLIYVLQVENDLGLISIILNARISPVNSTIETLRIQLLYITAILIGLAALLALFISQRISRPVIVVNQAAAGLAKGDYSVRFEGRGYREISELSETLNHAAHALSQVEKLRRELIANVSHDLRTPLTVIAGYAEAIRDLPGENTAENAQIILDEAQVLGGLVADMMDLSRLQSGGQEMKPERFCLTDRAEETIRRIEPLLKGDERINFAPGKDAFVTADSLQISQVIYNLLANALTHTAPGTPVEVRQTVEDGWVTVAVRDFGQGIPQEQLPHIWERYYKADKSHTRARVGTGLGLSIVREVLERHGARYGAQSEVGEGSTFWFSLELDDGAGK